MNPLPTDNNCKLQTKFKKHPPEGTVDTWEKGLVWGKFPIYYGLQLQSIPHRAAKTPLGNLQSSWPEEPDDRLLGNCDC